MKRLIITYNIVQIYHIDIGTVKTIVETKTISTIVPNNILQKYNGGEYLDNTDLLEFNKIEYEPPICRKLHRYEDKKLKCEMMYYFAIQAKIVVPKYIQMMLIFDDVMAYHEGYCTDAKGTFVVADQMIIKTTYIPDNMLGIYDDDGEIIVTEQLRKEYSYTKGECYGSGYCDFPETDDPRFNMIKECNVNNYILIEIKLVE
jgi:hypothetical protein